MNQIVENASKEISCRVFFERYELCNKKIFTSKKKCH